MKKNRGCECDTRQLRLPAGCLLLLPVCVHAGDLTSVLISVSVPHRVLAHILTDRAQSDRASRALRLEPTEVDTTADKGSKRVRVDSTDESSMQVDRLRARATACGTSWPCGHARPAHCWHRPDHWPELRLLGSWHR
eukprot:scaffold8761_cov97-Isochrysis_galbana.AAC.6